MARFMRAIQFPLQNKLDRPDKPGDDEYVVRVAVDVDPVSFF